MIPEVIHRKPDAVRTTLTDVRNLIHYVCGKAFRTATCNLVGHWTDATWQIWAIAGGNRSRQTLTYHLCLSWVEDERPTPDQMIAAARRALQALGLKRHQAVIGIHRDRDHWHVHIVVNRIHPLTFVVFHASQDYARLEKVCREIERAHGWPADRGRFNPVIVETADGPKLKLDLPTDAQKQAKQSRRQAAGLTTQSDLNYTRKTGMIPLIVVLSDAWKARIRSVLTSAATWTALHAELRDLNLEYTSTRSGARLMLRGSNAFLTPSQLGPGLGLQRMARRLGSLTRSSVGVDPADLVDLGALTNRLYRADDAPSGRPPTQAAMFAARARAYVAVTADQDMADRIARIDFECDTPCIALATDGVVMDMGDAIVTGPNLIDDIHARITLAMAAVKGWTGMAVSGAKRFVKTVVAQGVHVGFKIGAQTKLRIEGENIFSDPVLIPLRTQNLSHVQAQIDTERQRLAAQRTTGSHKRAHLAKVQRDDRDRLHALIGSGRGLRAQAMRAGLALHHAQQRSDLRQRLMMIGLMMTPIRPARQMLPSDTAKRQQAARRTLAVLTPDGTPAGWAGGADLDHTACRQLWVAADIPTLATLGIGTGREQSNTPPDTRRIVKDGHILKLFAHRDDNGSIVGFAFTTLGPDNQLMTGIGAGGHQTVHVLNGPGIQQRLVVVAFGDDALAWARKEGRTDTTYISTHGAFGPCTTAALVRMLTGRTVVGAFDTTPEGDALFADLMQIVPATRLLVAGDDYEMAVPRDALIDTLGLVEGPIDAPRDAPTPAPDRVTGSVNTSSEAQSTQMLATDMPSTDDNPGHDGDRSTDGDHAPAGDPTDDEPTPDDDDWSPSGP